MVLRKQKVNNSQNKKVFWILGGILSLLLLFWVVFAPGCGLLSYLKLRQEIVKLTEENRRLEERNVELTEEIHRLRTDEQFLEKVARQKHGLLKKDETVFDFAPAKKKK